MVKERKTKWNTTHVSIMKKGIFFHRNGIMNTVEIEKRLGIPPRTLRRYVSFSRDPKSKFFLDETRPERIMKEASLMSYEELMSIHLKHEVKTELLEEPKVDMLDPDLLDPMLLDIS